MGCSVLQGWILPGNSARIAYMGYVGFLRSSVGLGGVLLDVIPFTTRLVAVSVSRLCRRSMSSLKCRRKSATGMGVVVSTMTNTQ